MSPMIIIGWLYGLSLFAIIIILIAIFLQKIRHKNRRELTKKAQDELERIYHHNQQKSQFNIPKIEWFNQYQLLRDQVNLTIKEQEYLIASLQLEKLMPKLKRRANSIIPQFRLRAIYMLEVLNPIVKPDFLVRKLRKEKRENIKFALVYSLIHHLDEQVLFAILQSTSRTSESYITQVGQILSNHFDAVKPFMDIAFDQNDLSIRQVILIIAKRHGTDYFSNYINLLIPSFQDSDYLNTKCKELILTYLESFNPSHIINMAKTYPFDELITKHFISLLAQSYTNESIDKILNISSTEKWIDLSAINIGFMTQKRPSLNLYIIEKYQVANHNQKHTILQVLSNRITYLLVSLKNQEKTVIETIIKDLVELGYRASIINFLNLNSDVTLEKRLFDILSSFLKPEHEFYEECSLYLDTDVLQRFNIERLIIPKPPKHKMPFDLAKTIWIVSIVVFVFIILGGTFLIRNISALPNTFDLLASLVVVEMNRYFVLYYLIANLAYIILIVLSFYGAKKQLNLWKLKSDRLLFEEHLLPSISILAPAYNEELSIVESVTSLLNIKYPEYEIIVINDGSSDLTLATIVRHFDLKRVNRIVDSKIQTKVIRGIYTNPNIPGLIVVDKVNGGKADALNVGINLSSKTYVCGIDADSVLDTDSLLRLSAVTLDEQYPIIALGGNIIPANGSTISNGKVEKTGFPKEQITRYQTMEYLRAFTTGRVGWSQLNSLLIISGAFGLFKRQELITIGGYITSSGIYKKDSVGEDMELVVRLTNNALRQKKKYYVKYIFHANCYTELPSDWKTLLKQRNRWHRGLIDILSYYRRMFLSPKYKQVGLVALPYFYLFEVIGPIMELLGTLVLALGILLGIISFPLFAAIFFSSVWLGIIISLLSLYIGELEKVYYKKSETFLLILYAIIENLGYRQFMSIHRAYSLFTALKESGKWGEMKRKGLSKT